MKKQEYPPRFTIIPKDDSSSNEYTFWVENHNSYPHRFTVNSFLIEYTFWVENCNKYCRTTVCKMRITENGDKDNQKIVMAIARNSRKDPFIRKIGMIVSFHRAIKAIFPNRNLRRMVFKEFWKIHGKRLYGQKYARVI